MSTPRTHPTLSAILILAVLAAVLATAARAQTCGSQAGGATCANCLCCSQFGFCGNTSDYCGTGCQSQCTGCSPSQCSGCPSPTPPPGPSGGVASILSKDLFEQMLLHRNDAACTARGFYTYEAFLAAAATFPAFGSTAEGLSVETRKREVAAFLGQTSHETTGGWPTAPDGPLTWGYCFKQEREPKSIYCDTTKPEWPCAPNKEYIGRGPIQLTWNYNYGLAGRALSLDLLNNPDLVAADAVVSFRTALWFWMTPQANKPSSHAVITGRWTPTAADNAAGRVPGYGVITNIINGGLECGIGPDPRVADRIGFYQRYCGILGVDTGSNLDCYSQRPFNSGVSSAGLAVQ
ncbi:chitinase 2-like isoform X7 [Lolium rigidum]|uniref:chitinase 2-like isoform X7 n=1 Tax=Lolium rigidum TaxID=89674 RepID=UPI001F5DF1DF|nr:chitinase 2-like isoform X7 [Lolium rigidum]